MTPERIDWLINQYVYSIQNERAWYVGAGDCVDRLDTAKFRRLTGNYISTLKAKLKDTLTSKEWAFILLTLWEQRDGVLDTWMNHEGTLGPAIKGILRENGILPLDVEPLKPTFTKGDIYAVYGDAYTFKPADQARVGSMYTVGEVNALRKDFNEGVEFKEIAIKMKRNGLGIVSKLEAMGLLNIDHDHNWVHAYSSAVPEEAVSIPTVDCTLSTVEFLSETSKLNITGTTTGTTRKGNTMLTNPNIAVDHRTIIFGQDMNDMKDEDLIAAIKRIEGDVSKLKEVKTKSTKIAAKITEMKANIQEIVAILDAR